jgi:hypothetical protein
MYGKEIFILNGIIVIDATVRFADLSIDGSR